MLRSLYLPLTSPLCVICTGVLSISLLAYHLLSPNDFLPADRPSPYGYFGNKSPSGQRLTEAISESMADFTCGMNSAKFSGSELKMTA